MSWLTEIINGESSATREVIASQRRRMGRFAQEQAEQMEQQVITLHADERGMLSIVSMVTMLFFLVLLSLVANIGNMANRKIETQNAADAATYTASTEMARAMNAVTASNHLMGEMLSFVIAHRAVGGWELEENNGKGERPRGDFLFLGLLKLTLEDIPTLMILNMVANFACSLGKLGGADKFKPFLYDNKGPANHDTDYRVKDNIKCSATVGDGKFRLKQMLVVVLNMKITAGFLCALWWIPFGIGEALAAAGKAIGMIAHLLEKLINLEWTVLNYLEKAARNKALWSVRNGLYNWMAPNAYSYMKFVQVTSGMQAGTAASSIAELNGYAATTWSIPQLLEIPVRPEPFPGSKEADNTWGKFFDPNSDAEGMLPVLIPSKSQSQDHRNGEVNEGVGTGTNRNANDTSETRANGDDNREAFRPDSVHELKFLLSIPPIGGSYSSQKYEFNQNNNRPYDFATLSGQPSPRRRTVNIPKGDFPDKDIWRSQLVNATYPWVIYDRKPVLLFTSWMVLSNTAGLFLYYTNVYTIERIQNLCTRPSKQAVAFIMKESSWLQKGHESWTGYVSESKRDLLANSFLQVKGYAWNPALVPFSPRVFPQQHLKVGRFGFAQAMIYNGNAHNPPQTIWSPSTFNQKWVDPDQQAEIGYDTLNWKPPMSDNPCVKQFQGYGKTAAIVPVLGAIAGTLQGGILNPPKVQVNWQNKMTPTRFLVRDIFAGPVLVPNDFVDPFKQTFALRFNLDLSAGAQINTEAVPGFLNNH